MELAEFTRQLGQLYAKGDRYRVIEHAHRALSDLPRAPEVATLTLRALVDLGLGGPARELLQFRGDLPDTPQNDALRTAVATLPHGRIRWSERAEIFAKNAEAVCEHRPELRGLLDSATELLSGLHLYRGSDGGFRISRRQPGRLREWLPDLTGPPEDETVAFPEPGRIGAIALVGLRCGPLLSRICEATHRVFLTHSKPICVIEADPVRFVAVLHCTDFSECFADERLRLFVGPDAAQQLEARCANDFNVALPDSIVNCCEDLGVRGEVAGAIGRMEDARAGELEGLMQQLEARCNARDAAYWLDRFSPPGPIVAFTSRFTTMLQYSVRDALHAFSEMGYDTHMIIEANDHSTLSSIEMCRAILDHDPTMVLLLDHLRYETPYLPDHVPLLTWIQDPMSNLLCKKAGASIRPMDFVCGYYFDQCTQEYGYPAEQFESADMPVSTRVFHDAPLDPVAQRRYACDISFVSNASTPIDRFHEATLVQYGPANRPLLQAIYARVREVLSAGGYLSFHKTASNLVRSVAAELGIVLEEQHVEVLKNTYAYRLFDWGRRQQTLEWVGDWARRTGRTFKLYGRGWEAHPTLSQFAAGVIEHGEPLRCANRASKLGLQLIPSGFRHQRSYELLACGALPLTRYCEADFAGLSKDEFARRRESGDQRPCSAAVFPGLDRIVFNSPDEFAALAERFLDDDDYRRELGAELAEVVNSNYTYTAVVRNVASAFHRHLERLASEQLTPAS